MTPAGPIRFVPLQAPLGAQVIGLEPSSVDDPAIVAQLIDALLEHSVLIIRDQPIASADFVALGRAFGELEILPEPEKRHPDHPEIFHLTNVRADGTLVQFDDPQAVFLRGTERWHTDSSFRKMPSLCTMLYAIEVPRRGGQTQFADMRAALRLLPPEDRDQMASLHLVHSYEYSRGQNPGRLAPMNDDERRKYPPVEHPWIRTHPDGSRSLFMGGHVSHIAGRPVEEGRQWIAEVTAQLALHDVVYEHRWQPHDLVIWDNRTTLHRLLPYDIANERRVMARITVAGRDPVT